MSVLLLKMRFQAKSPAVLGPRQLPSTIRALIRPGSSKKYIQVEAIGEIRIRALTEKKSNRLNEL